MWVQLGVVWGVLLAWMFWVSWTDIQTGRILNRSIVLGVLGGLVLRGALGGFPSVWNAILGLIVGILLGLLGERIPLAMGRWGMGDAKCLAVIGVFLGWTGVVATAFIATGLFALVRIVSLTVHPGKPVRSFTFAPVLTSAAALLMAGELGVLLWTHG